jgi:hypothetical protein
LKEQAMDKGQTVLASSSGIEGATGLAMLVAPGVVAKLLLGSEITGVSIIVANVAGIALISLAIACWPRGEATEVRSYRAMLVYNLLIALLLAETGISAVVVGMLLWPAVALHMALTVLIALASIGSRWKAAHP